MSIKFIFEGIEDAPVYFKDVEANQFFVDQRGCLCQKVNKFSYNSIACPGGLPWAMSAINCDRNFRVKRILDHVTRIEF
jgi:hypothetical protein